MYQTQTLTPFTPREVDNVPEREGVYQLFDASQELTYIGRSDNLRRRLSEHLNTSDSCIKNARYFVYEVTNRSEEKEQQMLAEYKRIHGRYPRCNDRG